MLYVKVNATSANVCVGFDVLGLSLDISNIFTFEKRKVFSFTGFENEFSNKNNNLVYSSYIEVFKRLNREPIPVEIGFSGNIPVSRGLGSSSSLIVAGVFAANYMLGGPLNKDELFNICTSIEGHPDNVAPAVYGGLVASYKKDNKFYSIKYDVSSNLKFITVIPPFKLSTEKARGVLPKNLEYNDIVHNMSRIVNLPRAFEKGDLNLLIDLFDDKLHEPYRAKLIKGYDELKRISSENNVAFAISGSGSTMLIIANDYSIIDKISSFGFEIKTPSIGDGVTMWED
ncbi:MAG: homoserine kinase [Acholeplasmatales bacterium]|nr:homoserine kinase [Acholeplasmatales bacterium]